MKSFTHALRPPSLTLILNHMTSSRPRWPDVAVWNMPFTLKASVSEHLGGFNAVAAVPRTVFRSRTSRYTYTTEPRVRSLRSMRRKKKKKSVYRSGEGISCVSDTVEGTSPCRHENIPPTINSLPRPPSPLELRPTCFSGKTTLSHLQRCSDSSLKNSLDARVNPRSRNNGSSQ